MIKILALVLMMVAPQKMTVVETYDNIMVVESADGNLYEYEFDGMTEKEMYAENVLIINDNVVVLN